MKTAISLTLLLACGTAALFAQKLPLFSADGPDAAAYGSAGHYPVGSGDTAFEKKYLVGSLSHFEDLFPTHLVSPSKQLWQFHFAPGAPPPISYPMGGTRYTLNDYLARLPITGLLIAKDDQILFEGYQYGRKDHDRFTSESMAKSIVAMLIGIAVSDHAIASINDVAATYVPELKGTPYGAIKIIDLLHMSSGITCQVPESLQAISVTVLQNDCKSTASAGTHFQYSAADSAVLGFILGHAVHTSLADDLQQKLWQPIGTESKATWIIDSAGHELPYCCFNATLRDYARFGRLLAFDGAWNGKQLIPSAWLLNATTIKDSDAQLKPGASVPFYGYGYQVWILPGPRRMFALLGARGQRIFVDPQSKLIMVQTAAFEKDIDLPKDAETIHLWLSLVHHYGQ